MKNFICKFLELLFLRLAFLAYPGPYTYKSHPLPYLVGFRKRLHYISIAFGWWRFLKFSESSVYWYFLAAFSVSLADKVKNRSKGF